jgi:lipopolysaccharide transport system permease protein
MSILSEPKPHLIIRPSSGWQSLDLHRLWQYGDLLMTLAQRDVKLRYRQTALGVIWVILQPLLAAGIFSFVFGAIAGLPSEGVPYIVYSYAGLLCWNAFNSTLSKTSSVLVQNAHLVSKVYFPRLILPLSTLLSTLVDFGVALGMMAVLMAVYGVALGWGLLLLPVWLLLTLLLSVGIGFFLSALMVSYRDVQYVVPVLTQLLFYASPVVYSIGSALGRLSDNTGLVSNFGMWFFTLNPLSGLLEAFRWSLLGRGQMPWGAVGYSAAFSLLVFVGGAFAFKKMERKFADVI